MNIYLYKESLKIKKECNVLILRQDNWDDYSYKSSFTLYYFDGKERLEIGDVKIIDNTESYGRVEIPEKTTGKLSENYCSLGQTKEYYSKIKGLGKEISNDILTSLNDCSYNEVIFNEFKELSQFKSSALRFSTAEEALEFSRKIFNRFDPKIAPSHSFEFVTQLNGFSNSYNLNFEFYNQKESKIPSNINVIIGRNGTGKTQILSDLAKTISGYGFDDANMLISSRENKFKDNKPNFGNVIVVSYSAFDNFKIPGINKEEKEELSTKGHIFGYKYCGLREISPNSAYNLKTINQVTEEFNNALLKIQENEKSTEWEKCIEPIINDLSFSSIKLKKINTEFIKLSSGQKIVLSILTNIFEHIKENSLVIIDEPETHLHPSLIAAFMHSIREMLKLFDSYAIIATHSPVVLQETPSKFVIVLKVNGKRVRTASLRRECFGEEISTLTEEVFNVSFEESNFYKILNALSEDGYTIDEIEKLFGRRLGLTARSFLDSIN